MRLEPFVYFAPLGNEHDQNQRSFFVDVINHPVITKPDFGPTLKTPLEWEFIHTINVWIIRQNLIQEPVRLNYLLGWKIREVFLGLPVKHDLKGHYQIPRSRLTFS